MRALSTAFLILLALPSAAQTFRYRVIVSERVIGTGEVTYTISAKSGVKTSLHLQLSRQDGTVTITIDNETDKDGWPTRTLYADKSKGLSRAVEKIFSKKDARVKITTNGKSVTKVIPTPKTGTIQAQSNLWFALVQPKLGAKDTLWELNNESLTWQQTTSTYVGPRYITLNGKRVKTNLVQSKEASAWLDDKGRIYQLDVTQGGLTVRLQRL